jgi:hypothetical protein
MVKQVVALPSGYKAIGPVDETGEGKAMALAERFKVEKVALARLKEHLEQHAERWPKDFSATDLVFRVVATLEDTPRPGWGTLVVEFGYRPRGKRTKKADKAPTAP